MVLTSTSHSRVEHVTSELASQLYTTTAASPPSYSDSTRLQQVVDSTSPPRKKTRAEKAGHSPAMDSTITSGSSIKPDPVYPSSSNPDLLSYKVSNSRSHINVQGMSAKLVGFRLRYISHFVCIVYIICISIFVGCDNTLPLARGWCV